MAALLDLGGGERRVRLGGDVGALIHHELVERECTLRVVGGGQQTQVAHAGAVGDVVLAVVEDVRVVGIGLLVRVAYVAERGRGVGVGHAVANLERVNPGLAIDGHLHLGVADVVVLRVLRVDAQRGDVDRLTEIEHRDVALSRLAGELDDRGHIAVERVAAFAGVGSPIVALLDVG